MSDEEVPSEAGVLDASQRALQGRLLERVSRTFALTIPRLAPALADVVGNGYLLCRLVDTIEDELPADLPEARREALYARFERVLDGHDDAVALAAELGSALRAAAPAGERELIARLPEVIAITGRFDAVERAALGRCVRTMAEGMHQFGVAAGDGSAARGLADVDALERYCYHVAGVVGEMLTELFCHHSQALAERRDALMALAVPFGNGLQLTNILKDVWDDHRRGVCWLPRDAFAGDGTDFDALLGAPRRAGGEAATLLDAGLVRLVALCRSYLDDAVRYVLLIPPTERGIRVFCLWSIGMAVLTLRQVHARRASARSRGARISRRSVQAALLMSDLCARDDRLLRAVHALGGFGLPAAVLPEAAWGRSWT